ncbi:R3H domain protein [Andreesenia angusta]|uniref:RNA-binding protein KhpB n=1 Tax=Andreesenia angusta TaxID=39480 RepID=A0A1S1V4E8_9FIRM|nr:RNA-binding cell elongation regulator Jag/EloR [Andreesenia angusta]OHW61305.1 R3H domain protein [Andreesenia angusta]
MKSVIKSAKTVEEAVDIALKELGLEREDVSIEVLEEPSKRFFGLMGTTPAKVKVVGDKELEYLAESFLKELLEKMNIEGSIKASKNKNEIFVKVDGISSTDKGILIGKRGSTLDSIQYLLSLSLNKNRDKYVKVTLDIEDYREKREQTLVELAKKLANTVKKNKKTIRLEPMNPYERRIIHSALQGDKGIVTYSEGEEPYRRVIVQLKKEK